MALLLQGEAPQAHSPWANSRSAASATHATSYARHGHSSSVALTPARLLLHVTVERPSLQRTLPVNRSSRTASPPWRRTSCSALLRHTASGRSTYSASWTLEG